MKDKERIKNIAMQIAQLEKKCQLDKNNVNNYLMKMEELTKNLSLEDILAIDEYIWENDILKK